MRYELIAYRENVTVGEEIRMADRRAHPDLAPLDADFWLFDDGLPTAFALLMRYDEAGHWLDAVHTDDAEALQRCRDQRDLALAHSVDLNTYLAQGRHETVA